MESKQLIATGSNSTCIDIIEQFPMPVVSGSLKEMVKYYADGFEYQMIETKTDRVHMPPAFLIVFGLSPHPIHNNHEKTRSEI